MITCERARPYLTAYGGRELSAATTAWVDAHLRDCPACFAEAGRYTAVSTSMRSIPNDAYAPPDGFASGVIARIAERESHAARRLIPIAPVEVARVVSENREAIMNGAAAAAVAAGAAWLAWRALKSARAPAT